VADLVLIRPTEIWLIDFKTDHFPVEPLAGKVQSYTPQLKLYAFALSKIYNRPVTRSLLRCLHLRETVALSGTENRF
jgi:ATP-dependent exoDNAse (exonuclease V) beta subunit